MPFLTDLDSRAAIKGTRDPLGIQQIWARFGRQVVGNLTTVSTSLRDFTITILGYHFAEKIAEESGPGSELATFLKWEQMAAYARYTIVNDTGFRGTERVQKNLDQDSKVILSADRGHQILSNQKIYGLWGLYSSPSRVSGLLDDSDTPRPSPPSREMLDSVYLPRLAKAAGRNSDLILEKLKSSKFTLDTQGKDRKLMEAIGGLLRPELLPGEPEFYRTHLLEGGPFEETQGRQALFAELLEAGLSDDSFAWTPTRMLALAKAARARGGEWIPLADRLERIRLCECVMAPLSMLFVYLLSMDAVPLEKAAQRIREAWGQGLRTIDPDRFASMAEVGDGDAESARRWNGIAQAAASGDYSALIMGLIDQNRTVMAERGGNAWLVEKSGVLDVRYRDEKGRLPGAEEIPDLWRYSYFVDSLRGMAMALNRN